MTKFTKVDYASTRSECNGVTESRHETAYHIAGDVRKLEESADDIDLDELDVDVDTEY